jgi:hypothetical protein
MMLAHIVGIPVEESVLQLLPAGAAIATAVVIAGRTTLGRLRRRLRHRQHIQERALEEAVSRAKPERHSKLLLCKRPPFWEENTPEGAARISD